MTWWRLLARNLWFHRRANVAVLLGCFIGAAVLTGALLVGDSMRGSLRAMTLERLGGVTHALVSDRFFRQKLGLADPDKTATAIMVGGSVVGPDGRRATKVNVIGTSPAF